MATASPRRVSKTMKDLIHEVAVWIEIWTHEHV
jgi:hypothetical protein